MLEVENLTKTYTQEAGSGGVRDVSIDIAAGEFYTLLGPSGCGKTTMLRSIAGLEEPSAGRMTLDGRVIFDAAQGDFVPANRRKIGMVFQSYAVWPHMNVFDNTAFPLRMARSEKLSEADIRQRTMRTLETMGLADYSTRSAAQLSGGQQQRLALARALVAEPRLLLLDEPLSNLDALLREQMRNELRRLQKEVGVTAIYVTHDQSEALALSDRIAIMSNGRIVQIGAPRQIYDQPIDSFVASFVGRSNLLRGALLEWHHGSAKIDTVLGPVLCQASGGSTDAPLGAALIRPEHVVVSPTGTNGPGPNRFGGRIAHVAFLGEATECVVQIKDVEVIVRGTAGLYERDELVDVFFPPEKTLAIAVPESR